MCVLYKSRTENKQFLLSQIKKFVGRSWNYNFYLIDDSDESFCMKRMLGAEMGQDNVSLSSKKKKRDKHKK